MHCHDRSQMMEALEARRLLSAELLPGGELLLVGTSGPDSIVVEPGGVNGQAVVFGVDGVSDGTVFDGVNALTIRLLAGPDVAEVFGGLVDELGAPVDATILGGPGADQLHGGDGNDSINGGGGTDVIRGNNGHDVLKGNTANDRIFGGSGNDRLVGGSGLDALFGDSGDDRVLGNTQADELFGGVGNDRILGGNGPDHMNGGDGNDFMEGRRGADVLIGGLGDDILKGLNGRDELFGGDGNDELRGNAQADELNGGAGNDVLLGGAGPDILFGGLDADEIRGGRGSDNFRARFSERLDFQAEDEFHTDFAGQGADFALIDNAMWDEIENFEAVAPPSATFWAGIDGVQELLAECGDELQTVFDAIDNLSDAEEAAILARITPIVASFVNEVGFNFENLTAGRLLQFFNELQSIDLGSMTGPINSYFACLGNHQEALSQVSNMVVELGQTGALDPFRDMISELLLELL